MDVNSLLGLEKKRRYIFRYKLDGQRVAREGMAVYVDRTVKNNGTIDLVFSGRPEFGTLTLNSEQVQSIYPMSGLPAPCYIDKKVRT